MKLNTFINGEVVEALKKIDDECIDLVIADPPYNLNVDDWDTFPSEEFFLEFTRNWLSECYRVMNDGGLIYVFNTPYNCAKILNIMEELGFTFVNWITWHKKDGFSNFRKKYNNAQESILFMSKGKKYNFNFDDIRIPYDSIDRMNAARKKGIIKNGKRWYPNPKGKLCTDVWEFSSVRHKKKVNGKTVKQEHPTPKPEDMIERMILSSSKTNDVVLDLFSGTGVTSYVAKKNKRNFIAIEKNKKYIELAKKNIKEIS